MKLTKYKACLTVDRNYWFADGSFRYSSPFGHTDHAATWNQPAVNQARSVKKPFQSLLLQLGTLKHRQVRIDFINNEDQIMIINWQKLAQIKELKDYFDADFQGFQRQITRHMHDLQQLEPEELDKLAILRVIEVTNGCTQWAFRRQDEQALSAEQTRKCMQVVIGFMNDQQIHLPSGRSLSFAPATEQLMSDVRLLYHEAFKRNKADALQEFHAHSTAHFLIYGRHQIEAAMQLVKDEFEPLFSPYFIQKGHSYMAPYLEALSDHEIHPPLDHQVPA